MIGPAPIAAGDARPKMAEACSGAMVIPWVRVLAPARRNSPLTRRSEGAVMSASRATGDHVDADVSGVKGALLTIDPHRLAAPTPVRIAGLGPVKVRDVPDAAAIVTEDPDVFSSESVLSVQEEREASGVALASGAEG